MKMTMDKAVSIIGEMTWVPSRKPEQEFEEYFKPRRQHYRIKLDSDSEIVELNFD